VIGTTLRQRFTLDKELGRGGMGSVFRAVDHVLDRPVAIKVLKELGGEEVGRRLRLEAQILARLVHQNIVRLYDFDEDAGTFYFIMEEVDGPSFHRRWKQLAMGDRLRILAQVAGALDYAHHQGVIHRDVKPANILLTSGDQAKLSDFGLSVLAESPQESGVARGTPQYMSPEQAQGKKLDYRTDLYALGMILYEVATGSLPFVGAPISIMAQQVKSQPDRPRQRNPELSAGLESLIDRLLAKDPAGRPASGDQVAVELSELIFGDRWSASAVPLVVAPGASPSTTVLIGTAGPATAGPATGSGDRSRFESLGQPQAPPLSRIGAGTVGAGAVGRQMIAEIQAVPILLDPEQRYLIGHFLAYLLGGSRRRGFFMRRPLDPLNADRARLILALTWLVTIDAPEGSIPYAAELLESRPDVRPSLSPIVLAKYLAGRDTPAKRKRLRAIRQQLQQASPYALEKMTDEKGLLNPGLMPQVVSDLWRLAPARDAVDSELVERWNRVTEAWRDDPEFRESVLRYATMTAADDPASLDLWPEVVYPLMERARWQRQLRSRTEAVWDAVSRVVVPAAATGVRMDRAIAVAVAAPDVEQMDRAADQFQDNPDIAADPPEAPEPPTERLAANRIDGRRLAELADDRAEDKGLVRLVEPDPLRFTLGELRDLWREALAALRSPAAGRGAGQGHRQIPVGPYRLAVIASIRGHKAGTVAIQGMPNKQVEMLVPSFSGGSASRPILAAWPYTDRSLVLTYLDARGLQRFILWDASTNQQTNFDDPADLNHNLLQIGLEAPDALDRVLTKRFRPRNPV